MKRSCVVRSVVAQALVAWTVAAGDVNDLPALSEWTSFEGRAQAKTVVKYDRPDRRPIWFGAMSRCEGVAPGGDYCLFLDLIEEGGNEWSIKTLFSPGSHDWEKSERVFEPARPVKEIRCYLLLRRTAGQAWFDQPFLRREMPPTGHVMREARRTLKPFEDADRVVRDVSNGRRVRREVSRAASSFSFASPLAADETAVWMADSMRRISPLEFPTDIERATRQIEVELARGECESAQICISAGSGVAVTEGTVSVSVLRTADGRPLAGAVEVRRVGYLARGLGAEAHPLAPDARELWLADPLLPLRTFDVSPGSTRGLWLTVRADRGAKPGLYEGRVDVSLGSGRMVPVGLRVRVRSFALPETFGLRTGYSVMDGFTRATYPNDFKARRRESWDILLDHRLNPDDISRTTPPDLDDLEYARARGMNSFNVLHLVPPPANPSEKWVCRVSPGRAFDAAVRTHLERTLPPYLRELRRRGLDRYAYLYGFDECGKTYYPKMLDFCREVRERYGLPVLTTAYMFRDVTRKKLAEDSPLATIGDWHCPLTEVYDLALAERYRAKGKQVWTYTCCGPKYPLMNGVSYEYPLIENRLLGWQVRQLRADGLLYWLVNNWPTGVWLDERETFFPEWDTTSSHRMPGDGVYLYPGREHVLPGIRLANLRDGVEDYEWLQLAESLAGRDAVEALIGRVVRSKTDFTRDPASVRAIRRKLGDLIEGFAASGIQK